MDEDQRAERFGLGPERVQFGVGQLGAIDAAADQRATQAELLDRGFELLSGQIGILQSDRSQADETVRCLAADFGKLLVLQFDNLGG